MNYEFLAFLCHFAVVIFIGVYFFAKSKRTEEEYFLGSRSMGPWVAAMSAQASDMSGWLLMGLPGSVMAFGLGQAWIGIGLAIGTAANWILCAKRLRCYSQAASDSITLPQYLTNRFAETKPTLQIISAVIFLVFFTVYVASSFVAGTTIFTLLFPNMAESTARLIFALIIVVCTFMGGFKAVCWTDFFQGLMMLVAVLVVPIVAAAVMNFDASALDTVYTYTAADGSVTQYGFVKSLFSSSWKDIVSGLAWGLGYFGMPHIIIRFMSIKEPKKIKISATVAIVWVVLSLVAVIIIAYMGRMVFAEELLTTGMQKTVFVAFARKLFPPFIAGLLMSAIIAASMSTADSQLLVASSSFTSDIYKKVVRKGAGEKEVLWVGRVIVLMVAIIAFAIASSKGSGAQAIMNMVENAWGGFGASFGPVILLSLFWKRTAYKGAVAGVVVGALVDVLWLFCLSGTGIYELFPGFVAGTLACIVGSKLDKEPGKDVQAIIDSAEQMLAE